MSNIDLSISLQPYSLGRSELGDILEFIFAYFFFSSRRRHTRLVGDWSSDVCSSDLLDCPISATVAWRLVCMRRINWAAALAAEPRSKERRVGKECRSRWSPYH